MLLMRLKNFNYLLGLLIFFFYSPLFCEDKIDIWKNKPETPISSSDKEIQKKKNQDKPKTSQNIEALEKIKIEESSAIQSSGPKIYGIYEPANFNFNLNMWSTTKAEDLRSSLKRLYKIKLSRSSNEILESILFSFSYPPVGMSEKEFVDLKINWLIQNDKTDLLESFLEKNEQFESKSKAVQYLVDKNMKAQI